MRKPNLIIPLANSYDQRGVKGYTNMVAALDQRKINCYYDPVKNSQTGGGKLALVKRPGVTKDASTYGTSAQIAYNLTPNAGSAFTEWWVFSKVASNDIRVSNTGSTVVIVNVANSLPAFVDHTAISGVDTVVLQVVLANGSAQRVFYSSAIATWTEITDGDFTALKHLGKMEHMDGYALILDNKNGMYNSDLNSLSAWNPVNVFTKQIKQDFPVGLARLNNQILLFGRETMEVAFNNGNPSGSPFSGIKQLQQKVGLAYEGVNFVPSYYAIVNKKMYFVGRESGGITSIGVYVYDGAISTRISTDDIDKILAESEASSSSTPIISYVGQMGFHGKVAVAICLTNIGADTTQRWLMYFPAWNDWFEWTSQTFSPVNSSGVHLGIGALSIGHRLYSFENSSSQPTDNWQDDGVSYLYSTQFKLPPSGPERKRMQEFGVIGDTARSANTLTIEMSDDDYQTWTTKATADLTAVRKSHVRGGTYIDRAIRLSNTNALETRLQSFTALVK